LRNLSELAFILTDDGNLNRVVYSAIKRNAKTHAPFYIHVQIVHATKDDISCLPLTPAIIIQLAIITCSQGTHLLYVSNIGATPM